MEKCLLLGNGGREAVLAEQIAKGFELYSIMPYLNPSIEKEVKKSKGKYIVGDPFDKKLVKEFIQKEKIESCVVSQDNLLQEGLIDLAKELGLKTFGPTSKGAKVEWSKSYALDIVNKLAPEMIIKNYNISNMKELQQTMENYKDDSFVVKPEGLTGGKGVKVGGIHFKGKQEGFEYAKACLEGDGTVIIQDKVEGREFTVMALTDGKNIVVTPTTFDYPYRFDEDKGPGTGGMGCLSFENGLLPFLKQSDIEQCSKLIRFIEFNARFGDPEAINVLNSLETPFAEVMKNIWKQQLSKENCKFKNKYTFTVYVVSPDYAIKSSESCQFTVNTENIEKQGAKIYFASTKPIEENKYSSVGTSRLFAVHSSGSTLEEAKQKTYNAMKNNIDNKLDYRKDIGTIYEH